MLELRRPRAYWLSLLRWRRGRYVYLPAMPRTFGQWRVLWMQRSRRNFGRKRITNLWKSKSTTTTAAFSASAGHSNDNKTMNHWPKSRRGQSRLFASMMAMLAVGGMSGIEPPSLGAYSSIPAPDEPKQITQHDLDNLERARLKRERKAAKKKSWQTIVF